jgi:alpha-1,4-N-acetylglucosaminyltransferase EXTL3
LGGHDPPDWIDTTELAVPVYYERAKRNSLTERFRKPSKMRTQAGFWVDDDLAFRPQDIEFGFDTYLDLGRDSHRIVGFSGRLVEKLKSGDWAYKLFALSYSLILTNAAFLDTQMLAWFWKEDERIRESIEYVDEHMNCEDILFNCKKVCLITVSAQLLILSY